MDICNAIGQGAHETYPHEYNIAINNYIYLIIMLKELTYKMSKKMLLIYKTI